MSELSDLLASAVPLFEGDRERLIQWVKDVEAADATLNPGAGFGMDTTGVTTDIEEFVGPDADAEVGGFDDGWIAVPGHSNGDCPDCQSSPVIVLSHRERDILLIDCLGCQTRYDGAVLGGDGS